MSNDTVVLKEYDYNTGTWTERGTVSCYTIAKSMTPENMAYLLEQYVNRMGNEIAAVNVGRLLQRSHRTLQRSVIVFCAKVIMGLGEQSLTWTDERNRDAIAFAQKVTELVDSIGYGGYV